MDRLITFESRTGEKLEYYSWEFIYGILETAETAMDYLKKKKIRVDAIGVDEHGELLIQEYKSSPTAPFTKNQKEGFPDLIKYGGIVKGEGKGIFKGGFVTDPEKLTVEVVRPNEIIDWRNL